jgi:hypothetical protein
MVLRNERENEGKHENQLINLDKNLDQVHLMASMFLFPSHLLLLNQMHP